MSEQQPTQEQQLQQQQQETNNQEANVLQINSVEDYRNEFQTILAQLFTKQSFLNTQYFIVNCLNNNLDLELSTLQNHSRIRSLLSYPQEIKGEAQLNRNIILIDEIQKCELINYKIVNQQPIISPSFKRERNTIIVNVNPANLNKFREFVESSPVFHATQVEGSDVAEKNIKVRASNDSKTIIAFSRLVEDGQKLFDWLFSQKFLDQEIEIQMTEFDYYQSAYYKIFNKAPTGFKSVIPVGPGGFVPSMMVPMFNPYFQNQNYNSYKPRQRGNYNNNTYNNNSNNNNMNNNTNGYNNENRYKNNNGYNKQYQGGARRGNNNQNNNNPKYNYSNKGQNKQYKQPNVNIEDTQQFPDL